jgi:hypothetical protein
MKCAWPALSSSSKRRETPGSIAYNEMRSDRAAAVPNQEEKRVIAIEHRSHCVLATVAGEFTLADYREFEENLLYEMRFHGEPNLLLDLSEMLGYTLDLVWEDIRFTREHRGDFGRIAVVTTDQWVTWTTWVARLFVDSEVRVFDSAAAAEAWLGSAAVAVGQG